MRRLSAEADSLEVDNHQVCGANAVTGCGAAQPS